jgi:hypothetical protein
MLDLNPKVVESHLNVRPFRISHSLERHPLFELQRIIELARRLPESAIEYNPGDIAVELDPSQTPHNGLSVDETLRRIETCGSWMVLKRVEHDPQYRALLDDCLDEVMRVAASIAPGMKRREGFIFVSSPRSVTPFHMDQEYNFLLQIRGAKTIHIFPRELVTDMEIEERCALGHRNLKFREEFQQAATTFDLRAGDGLHIPIAAPHWVENGEAVSVSFSITFQTPAAERRSALYHINGRLRQLGLMPHAVGISQFRDSAKYLAVKGLRCAAYPLRMLRATVAKPQRFLKFHDE